MNEQRIFASLFTLGLAYARPRFRNHNRRSHDHDDIHSGLFVKDLYSNLRFDTRWIFGMQKQWPFKVNSQFGKPHPTYAHAGEYRPASPDDY